MGESVGALGVAGFDPVITGGLFSALAAASGRLMILGTMGLPGPVAGAGAIGYTSAARGSTRGG